MVGRRTRALVVALAVVELGIAAVLAATPSVAASQPDTVRATLAFVRYGIEYRRLQLRIVRGARSWRSPPLGASYARPRLLVRDLDGDGEREVVLDVYTGGAHCCTISRIYRYSRGRYRLTSHDWGNVFPPYRIVDFGRDGRLELRSADDRFAYVFTSFAGSLFPVRIWRYDRGRMLDVTRRYPGIVARDAARLWQYYRTLKRDQVDVRGALRAYLRKLGYAP